VDATRREFWNSAQGGPERRKSREGAGTLCPTKGGSGKDREKGKITLGRPSAEKNSAKGREKTCITSTAEGEGPRLFFDFRGKELGREGREG